MRGKGNSPSTWGCYFVTANHISAAHVLRDRVSVSSFWSIQYLCRKAEDECWGMAQNCILSLILLLSASSGVLQQPVQMCSPWTGSYSCPLPCGHARHMLVLREVRATWRLLMLLWVEVFTLGKLIYQLPGGTTNPHWHEPPVRVNQLVVGNWN